MIDYPPVFQRKGSEGSVRYKPGGHTIFAPVGTPAIVILHELGHAVDPALCHWYATATPITARLRILGEAKAWRFAVRVIRKHRQLTANEKAHIRRGFIGHLVHEGWYRR